MHGNKHSIYTNLGNAECNEVYLSVIALMFVKLFKIESKSGTSPTQLGADAG